MSKPTYLKVLGSDNRACHGGKFDYTEYLPTADGPGKMLPEREPVTLCQCGWHWCDPESLMREWAIAGMQVFEAEPVGDVIGDGEGKYVSASGRLVTPYALPEWWLSAMRFIHEDIPAVPWLTPDGNPRPEWELFVAPTLNAAWSAARNAARSVAWGAAWNAARDAAWNAGGSAGGSAGLYTMIVHSCDGLPLDAQHINYGKAQWEVWQKGYCLLGDCDGVLYVCAKEGDTDE